MVESTDKSIGTEDLYKKYERVLTELFGHAKSVSKKKFLSSLSPETETIIDGELVRHRIDIPDMEIQETIHTHSVLESYIRNEKEDRKTRIKLMLLVSFHILEADRWHSILGNLLKVIAENNYELDLLVDDALKTKRNKIERLLKKCKSKGLNLSIEQAYDEIINDNILFLRNAFFHSQYHIPPNGSVILITKGAVRELLKTLDRIRQCKTLKPMTDQSKKQRRKTQYRFDEVQEIYRRVITFITVFALKRNQILRDLSPTGKRSVC